MPMEWKGRPCWQAGGVTIRAQRGPHTGRTDVHQRRQTGVPPITSVPAFLCLSESLSGGRDVSTAGLFLTGKCKTSKDTCCAAGGRGHTSLWQRSTWSLTASLWQRREPVPGSARSFFSTMGRRIERPEEAGRGRPPLRRNQDGCRRGSEAAAESQKQCCGIDSVVPRLAVSGPLPGRRASPGSLALRNTSDQSTLTETTHTLRGQWLPEECSLSHSTGGPPGQERLTPLFIGMVSLSSQASACSKRSHTELCSPGRTWSLCTQIGHPLTETDR